jgi:hypothetical protein
MVSHFLSHIRNLKQTKTHWKSWLKVTKDVVKDLCLWLLLLTKANQGLLLNPL